MTAGTRNDHALARAQTMRTVAIVLAVIAFGALVYSFGMGWKAWYQVPLGLAAWASIEWQRRCGQRIKELTGARSA